MTCPALTRSSEFCKPACVLSCPLRGQLFLKGNVYLRSNPDQIRLCLGFRGWGAQSVDLLKHTVDDQVAWIAPIPATENAHCLRLAPKPEVFYSITDGTDARTPISTTKWMFNSSCAEADCPWTACSVQAVPPCLVPAALQKHTSVLKQVTAPQSLVRHAVRHGIWLEAATLTKICKANAVPEPPGTGAQQKNGRRNVLKRDWAEAALKKFASDLSAEERAHLLELMMGNPKATKKRSTCPEEVLQAMNCLDPDNASMPMFRELKHMAEQQTRENARAGRGLSTAKHPAFFLSIPDA